MLEAEQEFVKKAKRGDAAAFGALYDHYAPIIYRFIAVRVSIQVEAEDLMHEVFLSAWQNLPGYREKGYPFSSWLYRIARNRVIDHYRTKKQHTSLDEPEQEVVHPALSVADGNEERLDLQIGFDRVQAAIEKLSPDQQDVIILRFIEDLTPTEIAKVLKKQEGAVRILQHRAILALKKLLSH